MKPRHQRARSLARRPQLRRTQGSNPRRLPLRVQTHRAQRHWMALRLDWLAAKSLAPERLYVERV